MLFIGVRRTAMKKSIGKYALGLASITCGIYCATTAFWNGQTLGQNEITATVFGAAFASIAVGSWFILPAADKLKGLQAWIARGMWLVCLVFVLSNAIGFTATNRGEMVNSKALAIDTYTRAENNTSEARIELVEYRKNNRWTTTAGCTNASVEASKAFCATVGLARAKLAASETILSAGKPASADAASETLAWVLFANADKVRRALPVMIAAIMELAASGFMWLAFATPKRRAPKARKPAAKKARKPVLKLVA